MESIFRWAHFSDIHFQTKSASFNTRQLRGKLLDYVNSNIAPCDALIISGDFRFAPDKEENPQNAVDYIKNLMKSLGISDTANVFTLPGNHDLDRTDPRRYTAQGIWKDYKPNNGSVHKDTLETLLKSFKFYNKLHELLKDGTQWNADNPHCMISLPQCNLLLLNTAITAHGNEDHENLILGSLFVRSLVSKSEKAKPIIAVGHHSLNELNPEEKNVIARYFDEMGIRLYLCGHSHKQMFEQFGEKGKEITVGCMKQTDDSVDACFGVGELMKDGTVRYQGYKWDIEQGNWCEYSLYTREYGSLYNTISDSPANPTKAEMTDNPMKIIGYSLLGDRGSEGIKYYWKKNNSVIESLALNHRILNNPKDSDTKTSAYTVSTSLGCGLSGFNSQCAFCGTGLLKYEGELLADDIALQCIFMAEWDSHCESWPEVRDNNREFAFMGQGEPGLNYPAVRDAIVLTDRVMEILEQKVSRYIVSTCGVTSFISSLIHDIRSGVFKNRVTLHFSLHEIDELRNELMPINLTHDYKKMLELCREFYQETKEKIGIGILMFYNYRVKSGREYTLTPERLEKILDKLDSEVFKIDLCTVNDTAAGKQTRQQSNEYANKLIRIVEKKGFEYKLFSSFGVSKHAGCGMLAFNPEDDSFEEAGQKSVYNFNHALKLLNEAKKTLS